MLSVLYTPEVDPLMDQPMCETEHALTFFKQMKRNLSFQLNETKTLDGASQLSNLQGCPNLFLCGPTLSRLEDSHHKHLYVV